MTADTPEASEARKRLVVAWIAGPALLLCVLALLAGLGDGPGALAGVATVVERLATAGALAGVYLGAAFGLGGLLLPLVRGAESPWALRCVLGLALMLTLSHLLGWLGLLSGVAGLVVSIGVCVAGLWLLARDLSRGRCVLPAPRAEHLLLIPGAGVLLVAASNPPGWLWDSEFRAFDALSYHLQLPQEWLARGRIEPLEHNVYSFLPGYVEGAFHHLAVLSGAPSEPAAGRAAFGLLGGDGWRAVACQMLHAGLTLLAAWLTGRVVRTAAARAGLETALTRRAEVLAAALFLATPWAQVVGSLAYNEMGVCALFAGAMLCAMDERIVAARRGAACGVLIALACGCKPTAMLFAGLPLAVLLAFVVPVRQWGGLALAGCAAGVAALAPWLLRNAVACGNPVFPYATGIFGSAHWSTEQVARFAASHHFEGSLADRLGLLVARDANDPAGARHRGLLHPQYFAFFPLVMASLGALALRGRSGRRAAAAAAAMLAIAIGAWLAATHVQARFLAPLLVPGAAAFGLAISALTPSGRVRYEALGVGALAVLAQGAWGVRNFATQSAGSPNYFLAIGPTALNGEAFRAEFEALPERERRALEHDLASIVYFNLIAPPGRQVYLLGDSTPFYFGGAPRYHTTYDASPLGDVFREAPEDPASWPSRLRARGIGMLLVNFGELERLRRTGWYDPAVTPQRVEILLREHTTPVREWPREGRLLVRLRSP